MRRRQRARVLRRLVLGPAAFVSFLRDPVAAVESSRRPPTLTPVGTSGALRPAPFVAWVARPARRLSTPAVA